MSFWKELFGGDGMPSKAEEDELYRKYMQEKTTAYEQMMLEHQQAMVKQQMQNYQYALQNQLANNQLYQYWQTYGTGSQTSASMASTTPEGKIKDKVRKALEDMDIYYTMPVTGGYGNSGVPDILACVEGRFFGIECKARGKTPTALQEKHLEDITASGGVSLVIDETNVDTVRELILANIGVAK